MSETENPFKFRELPKFFYIEEEVVLEKVQEARKIKSFVHLNFGEWDDPRCKKDSADKTLKNYLKLIANKYKSGKAIKKYVSNNQGERYYYDGLANESFGLLYLPNPLRGFILPPGTKDVDTVNCFPGYLIQIFNKVKIACPNLHEYVSNRDHILITHKFNKTELLTLINDKHYKTDNLFLQDIHIDIYQKLIPRLISFFPELFENSKLNNKRNAEGTFMARFLQKCEQQGMYYVMEYLKRENIRFGCLVYDGIHLYNNPTVDFNELEKYVSDNTEFNVKFKIKDFDIQAIEDEVLKCKTEIDKVINIEYKAWKEQFEKVFFHVKDTDSICHYEYKTIKLFSSIRELFDKLKLNPDFLNLITRGPNNELFPDDYPETFLKMWADDINKRSYMSFDFLPEPCIVPDNVYNMWKGFAFSDRQITISEEEQKKVKSTFYDFLDHLSGKDKKVSDYLVCYLADIIQNPGRKPGICITFIGEEGAGKGSFCLIVKGLIGSEYYLETSSLDEVIGRFNGNISQKLFINIDEAVAYDMIVKSGPLRNLITGLETRIENKNQKSYYESSFHRCTSTTNEENSIKISNTNRRDVALSPTVINPELSDRVYEMLGSTESMVYLFHMLMNIEITYKNIKEWQKSRPETEIYREIKSHFIPGHIKFLFNYLRDVTEESFCEINDSMYDKYKSYIDNDKITITKDKFMKEMCKVKGIDNVLKRIEGKVQRCKQVNKQTVLDYLIKEKGYVYIDYETIDILDDSDIEFRDDTIKETTV